MISINEANIRRSRLDNCNHFPGYNHELNLMSETIDISRNSIFNNSNINYKRRLDLESKETCNIWLEITIGRKKLLVMGGYF